MDKKVAIIGCGTIGGELAKNIDNKNIPNCILSSIFDIDQNKLKNIYEKLQNKPVIFENFKEFIESAEFDRIDLIIEAASINAASKYIRDILQNGKDIMIMSIGVFSDDKTFKELQSIIESKHNNIYLPSGAIGGIDIIRSIKKYIESITLITTKNNNSLKGAPFFSNYNINIDEINNRQVIFDGNAGEAIIQFPSNVNVAALISLAGIGFKKTNVKIIVDPNESNNTHEIIVKWIFGEFNIKVINKPSIENPKTSYLAVLSAIECLRSICKHDLKIGS